MDDQPRARESGEWEFAYVDGRLLLSNADGLTIELDTVQAYDLMCFLADDCRADLQHRVHRPEPPTPLPDWARKAMQDIAENDASTFISTSGMLLLTIVDDCIPEDEDIMIDTTTETHCKNCGKSIIQTPGHRHREYCNDTCKQLAYRRRKAQPSQDVTIVDESLQQRIAELEQEVERLQGLLNLEQRFRTDTQAWNFRRWIRQHQYPRWKEITFFQRFLDDRRLHVNPQTDQLFAEMPKSLYLHRLRQYGYSEEEIALFKEAWIDMLFMET